MRYKNNQDKALEVHKDANLISPVFPLKLSIDAEVEGEEVLGVNGVLFVKAFVKGNLGYIERRLLTPLDVDELPDDDELPIPPIPPLPDKPRGEDNFIVVKNSMQVYNGLSRPSVILPKSNISEVGYPDMWAIKPEDPKGKPHFTLMTPAICHWLFRINVEKYMDMKFNGDADYMKWFDLQPKSHPLILDWKSLTKGDRSHTNRAGSDTNWDPISQKDQNGKELMRFFQVITGGWVAKRSSERALYYKVECIKASGNYRQFTPDTHPWLFDVPLITARVKVLNDKGKWDGKTWRHETRRYGQFGGNPILPAMLPADDKCLIEKSICRILDPYEPTPDKFS